MRTVPSAFFALFIKTNCHSIHRATTNGDGIDTRGNDVDATLWDSTLRVNTRSVYFRTLGFPSYIVSILLLRSFVGSNYANLLGFLLPNPKFNNSLGFREDRRTGPRGYENLKGELKCLR
jgi:hypothetical protein